MPDFCLVTAAWSTAGRSNTTPSLYLSSPNTHINGVTSNSLRPANHTRARTVTHAEKRQQTKSSLMAALFGKRSRALEKPTLSKYSLGREAGPQEEYSLGSVFCERIEHRRQTSWDMKYVHLPVIYLHLTFFISFPLPLALVKTFCSLWTANLNCGRLEIVIVFFRFLLKHYAYFSVPFLFKNTLNK